MNSHPRGYHAKWRRRDTWYAYMLLAPLLLLVALFLVYPVVSTAFLSFTTFQLGGKVIEFAGFRNYIAIFTERALLDSLFRTLYFTGAVTFGGIVLGLTFSLVLTQDFRGRGIVRSLVIIPWGVPAVINGVLWRFLYSPQVGGLNGLLYSLGIIHDYVAWLSYPFLAMNLVILADLWKRLPFVVVVLVAALSSLPPELSESAKIDGAGPVQLFWRVTFPLLQPTIALLLVLTTAWSMQSFDLIYAITRGGPGGATTTLPYYAYREIFDSLHYGAGTALGYSIAIVTAVIGLLYVKLFYKKVEY